MKTILSSVGIVCALVLGFAVATPSAIAAEIYVDADAPDGGNGTPELPLSTLNDALPLIVAGEANAIYARGTFAEEIKVTSAHEGKSEDTRTVFQPWPGENRPTIDARNGGPNGQPIYNVFHIDNADYVTVKGFEIIGGKNTNIWFMNGSSYGVAEDNIVSQAGIKGICFRNAPYGTIRNNVSFDNAEHGIVVPEDLSDHVLVEGNTVYGNGISGINVSPVAEDIIVRGNITHGNNTNHVPRDGGGIVVVGIEGSRNAIIEENNVHDEVSGIVVGPRENVTIRNNRVENVEEYALNLRELQNSSITQNRIGRNGYGMSLDRSHNIVVDGNVITGTALRPAISVMHSDAILLRENTIANNATIAISVYESDGVRIIGNTIVDQPVGVMIEGLETEQPRVDIQKNTFDQNRLVFSVNVSDYRALRADYNTYSRYMLYIKDTTLTPEQMCARTGQECHSVTNNAKTMEMVTPVL